MDVAFFSEQLQADEVKAGNKPQVRQKEFERGEWHAARNAGEHHPQQVKHNRQADGMVKRAGVVAALNEQFEVKKHHHAEQQGFGRQRKTDAELLNIDQYTEGRNEGDEEQ